MRYGDKVNGKGLKDCEIAAISSIDNTILLRNCDGSLIGWHQLEGFSVTEVFKPGDYAIAKRFVAFNDGSLHEKNQVISVTVENVDYFNTMNVDYIRKESYGS